MESVKNQTYQNVELIVVDNNSTDKTKEIAGKYTDKVFNKGPERSAQVNFGVEKAIGRFVYKVDSDFILDKEVIDQCVRKIGEGFDAVVVHNSPDVRVSWIARVRKFEVDMYKYDITHSSARFLKKEVYGKIGGYNEKITAGEDYDFQNKLSKEGFKTGFIDAEALHLGEPINLWKHLKKYYNYGKDFVRYEQENKNESKKQLGFFRGVYFKNWKKFIYHPILGIGFIMYNFFKFAFGGAGYFVGKFKKTKEYMFKNIIPNLISFETEFSKIPGFYLSDNFNFYPQIEMKNLFHYKIFIDNNIIIPKQYDFRNGYFLKFLNKWYYERKLFGIITLKFSFDRESRVFVFNKNFMYVFFEIGHIFPVGKHMADIISLDLFLGNFFVIGGCAFTYKSNNYCVIAPSFNGKTTLISNILNNKDSKFISEDILVMDLFNMKIYPIAPRTNLFARKTNKELVTNFLKDRIEIGVQRIDNLFLFYNSRNSDYLGKDKKLSDFFNLLGFNFLRNPYVNSVIFFEDLTSVIREKKSSILELEDKIKYKFFPIKNFSFKFFN